MKKIFIGYDVKRNENFKKYFLINVNVLTYLEIYEIYQNQLLIYFFKMINGNKRCYLRKY